MDNEDKTVSLPSIFVPESVVNAARNELRMLAAMIHTGMEKKPTACQELAYTMLAKRFGADFFSNT